MLADGVPEYKVAKEVMGTNAVSRLKTQPMKEALAMARDNLVDITMIRRVDIVNGILDQIDKADKQAEPATAIKGWCEIGKMLGFYEPERIKVEITMSQGKLKSKMEAMSDEELLAIAEGRLDVIEGEAEVVHGA